MKLLLDTNAYVGFKRNLADLVEIIVGSECISGLQHKPWSTGSNL